jgi:thiol-disulfide isomerase/thioredoxin
LEDSAVTSALLVVVVFLAIITFGNIFLLFAVIRRLRSLQELVVPSVPVPDVGTVVEPFQVETTNGASLTADDLAGEPVLVAILSNTCPACQAMAGDLVSLTNQSIAPTVFLVADPQHDSSTMLSALDGIGRIAVVGRDDPALAAFGGINAFPTVLVLRDGRVAGADTRLEKVIPALHERPRATARSAR